MSLPPTRDVNANDTEFEGLPTGPGSPQQNVDYYQITTIGYFETMRIPIVKGREFSSTDRRGNAHVVILNQTLAKRLFGDKDPIGQRVAWTGDVLKFIPVPKRTTWPVGESVSA